MTGADVVVNPRPTWIRSVVRRGPLFYITSKIIDAVPRHAAWLFIDWSRTSYSALNCVTLAGSNSLPKGYSVRSGPRAAHSHSASVGNLQRTSILHPSHAE